MDYELDFIGLDDSSSKSADAIGVRWKNKDGSFTIGIYDGGFESYGEELKNHIIRYYSRDGKSKPKIDFVICSHSDQDHVAGLKVILQTFEVKKLYMNRPWLYVSSLIDNADDGRMTEESLKQKLKESYSEINKIEELAREKGIRIFEIFQGENIENVLRVLSPSKDFYIEKLILSQKTPLRVAKSVLVKSVFDEAFSKVQTLFETWTKEWLREDVETSMENEQSVVILGCMEKENFLLTGDAGKEALMAAMDYAEDIDFSISKNVSVYQIPHHGGRRNVTPKVLNRFIGNIVPENTENGKIAMVSASKESDHPKKMVINAFIRRGVKVFETKGKTIQHHVGFPAHNGWGVVAKQMFTPEVEKWDD